MIKYQKKIIAIVIIIVSVIFGGISISKAIENEVVIKSVKEIINNKKTNTEDQETLEQAPFILNYKDSVLRSNYNKLLRGDTTLENEYNLKDNITIINKDQKKTGSCWAFAFSSMVETNISKTYNKVSEEYSPMHLEYISTTMFNRTLAGGNSYIATAYAVSGRGPVLEKNSETNNTMPFAFENVYDETQNSSENSYLKEYTAEQIKQLENDIEVETQVKDVKYFANIYKKIDTENSQIQYTDGLENVTYTENEVLAIRNEIKEHIKNYGALSAGMYSDIGKTSEESTEYASAGGFYKKNEDSAAYYCNDETKDLNHNVIIVGWDDNYSKDNFSDTLKPINDGAYIILNSYGEEFGENGYMYISYDDVYIEQFIMGIKEIEEGLNYDNLYQYDELGGNYPIGLNNTTDGTLLSNAYAANVFTRDNTIEKDEYLNEVGIYLLNAEGVQVYVINEGISDINIANLGDAVAIKEGLETGYHTISLSSPVKLTGNTFTVIVQYTNDEGAVIPLEFNYESSNIETTNKLWNTATANEGESYIGGTSTNNAFVDINTLLFDGTNTIQNTNVCIKAFTTLQEKSADINVETVSLDKTTLSMQVGDKSNLVSTITPTDATNKEVNWTSSSESVATISETGIITAIAEGTTTITATSKEDSTKKATCLVTVTAKTNTDDDIYKSDPDDTTTIIQGDGTTATTALPNTGKNIIFITVVIFVATIGIIGLVKYKSYKEVK